MSMRGEGLTTTKAPFIEEAKSSGLLFIHQPYELYSEENHKSWSTLYSTMLPLWDRYANDRFLKGIETLKMRGEKIPKLEEVNRFLKPITGFQAKAVSGYIPGHLFFEALSKREFPTTITIRAFDSLSYLPEPDIFHDVAGHVPMHTDPVFADVLVQFGSFARRAAERCSAIRDKKVAKERLNSCIKALSRVFWFSVEFGLMKIGGKVLVYGSGLLSSPGEIVHCVESKSVQRSPFQLNWIINQYFEIDHYQPLLFTIDSFEQLFEEVNRLGRWLDEGRLDNVAPGEPNTDDESLEGFLSMVEP